jgi:hypothetical protein
LCAPLAAALLALHRPELTGLTPARPSHCVSNGMPSEIAMVGRRLPAFMSASLIIDADQDRFVPMAASRL